MRLIKICLAENNPFWFLGDLRLTTRAPVSQYFDIDKLTKEGQAALDASLRRCVIKAFDIEENRIKSLASHNLLGGGALEEEEEESIKLSDLPEIVSVTCEADEEEEVEETEPTERDYEEAEVLLKKNGNTVRKTISELLVNRDTISLLLACKKLEKNERNRKGVLKELDKQIGDYYGD